MLLTILIIAAVIGFFAAWTYVGPFFALIAAVDLQWTERKWLSRYCIFIGGPQVWLWFYRNPGSGW